MSEKLELDCVVIGAGVVGLAIARSLAMRGRDVILLEARGHFGEETSSRNSEVIHAGLYYKAGSHKARFCVDGRRKLYDYLASRSVTHDRCGKLVVSSGPDEDDALEALYERSLENGVEDLFLISGKEAREIEPELSPQITRAIWSKTSGLFDSHNYMLALLSDLEAHGGQLVCRTPVMSGQALNEGFSLQTGGEMPAEITCRLAINAAGHNAVPLARNLSPEDAWPTERFVKGSYFTLSGRAPFARLIYPMPTSASLGLHYTRDLGARGRFGPDAEWLPEDAAPPFDYDVSDERRHAFEDSIRNYWPGLKDGALTADYSGVRPKLVGPGEPSGDFHIQWATNGSIIHLLGIESPGLTSSLAIADHVTDMVTQRL